jgi:hypothetical protein
MERPFFNPVTDRISYRVGFPQDALRGINQPDKKNYTRNYSRHINQSLVREILPSAVFGRFFHVSPDYRFIYQKRKSRGKS